ncbi:MULTISPECIES: HAD domain-containing protein [Streptomyces]|uniref:Secreted protein n=1 Tax=Streptomyces tsukubensis (strain DSM 42081 / NBRC 108919 / NRRL 18488 / 9993) TaxID=1114943 RepID=I2MUG5_STRT9|nr:HAD domain-containing protein [Streptomyces tsukubensis]MYS63285.1 hypothetical protein [Streptomyces sp. SID5473]AZK92931.1 hypothetical protein B7R87_02825 [Streptomyces tsukubensis]EIF88412.1 hypothetical protein [Streptomyces tsukubensis NRRL18488]QKM70907.1 hypothetical protein STSU_031005 [Streptomyces tsukubensis NRRL18488]TAI40975.1 hypothetical protein EWI31_28840 [Streptomyces tsukubensis]
MTGSRRLPLLFLDVDGPLIPFGEGARYPPAATRPDPGGGSANPLLSRVDPRHGAALAALPCELVWATTWMEDANECIAPLLGLPQLPLVVRPEPSEAEERDERDGLHWKTRMLVERAAGRPFARVDDEMTGRDRAWVAARHPGPALLHRVDARVGLSDGDFEALGSWLRQPFGDGE